MSDYEVILKQLEPQLVAGVRDTLPSYPAVGRLYSEVCAYTAYFGAGGIVGAIWHNGEFKTSDIDGEAIVFLKESIPASARVKVYELPAVTVASIVHKGAYNKLSQAYEAIGHWIEANGYKIVGSDREIYLYHAGPVRQDDESYVTEIQFTVAKE